MIFPIWQDERDEGAGKLWELEALAATVVEASVAGRGYCVMNGKRGVAGED
jgi:hypothetical protein